MIQKENKENNIYRVYNLGELVLISKPVAGFNEAEKEWGDDHGYIIEGHNKDIRVTVEKLK